MYVLSGVNVMIAIFGDFRRFSAIFGDFRQFSPIFGDLRRFSPIFGAYVNDILHLNIEFAKPIKKYSKNVTLHEGHLLIRCNVKFKTCHHYTPN
jgi:hypothetical protein